MFFFSRFSMFDFNIPDRTMQVNSGGMIHPGVTAFPYRRQER
jgi:hypothetical protein